MAMCWIDSKIMKQRWSEGIIFQKDLIALSEMSFQISYEPSDVLFLRAIIKRKDNEIREDKKNSKK